MPGWRFPIFRSPTAGSGRTRAPKPSRSYNAQRVSVNAENPITAFQIELQMAHRIVALAILILTALRMANASDVMPGTAGSNGIRRNRRRARQLHAFHCSG